MKAFILLFFVTALSAGSVVICANDDSLDCYPKVFSPSNKWKTVREGQMVPPGLHVRLNLETGEQEARLLQDEDEQDKEMVPVSGVLVGSDTIATGSEVESPKASLGDNVEFSSAIQALLGYDHDSDPKRINSALDYLSDLSHDIDFGTQLTENPMIFEALNSLADVLPEDSPLREKSYRIMGSTLRNNEQAIENFLHNNAQTILPRLYQVLEKDSVSDTIQKRVLGVIHAISIDKEYAFQHLNPDGEDTGDHLNKLISVFPLLGQSAKDRLMLILEDLNIVGYGDSRDPVSSTVKFSAFLQSFLGQERCSSETQFQIIVKTLVDIHKAGRIPVSDEFLQWLSREVEKRRKGIKAKSNIYSHSDSDFDSFLIGVRHSVFGNPNADRKLEEL